MQILMGDPLPYAGPVHVGSHHYADLFTAHGHRVFWLGGPSMPLHPLRAMLGSSVHRALTASWRVGGLVLHERLLTYHPMTLLPYRDLPGLNQPAVLRRTLDVTLPPVTRVLARHSFDAPDVLWLSQAFHTRALLRLAQKGRIRAGRIIYRMADDYAAFAGVPRSMIAAEREIVAAAQTVFVTGRALFERIYKDAGAKVIYLPNGVTLDHFSGHAPEPPDLAAIPRPRALFVGTIKEWFDADLLAAVARTLPAVAFVLVGPARRDLSALAALPNVHLTGPRPYATVPGWMRHSDVGLMPYVLSPLTHNMSHVKLFEYAAAGLPVVATPMREVIEAESPARLATTPDAFAAAVQAAIAEGRDRPELAAFAAANTWEQRYRTVAAAL